jgi:hypothetical protein
MISSAFRKSIQDELRRQFLEEQARWKERLEQAMKRALRVQTE